MNWIKKKWVSVPASEKTVRNFGLILSAILFVLGILAFFQGHGRYKIEWPLSVVIGLLAIRPRGVLSHIYRAWMIAAEIISWFVLRVVLGIFFYLVVAPIGFLMRLFQGDLLDETIDRKAVTYWKKRPPKAPREQYERLF